MSPPRHLLRDRRATPIQTMAVVGKDAVASKIGKRTRKRKSNDVARGEKLKRKRRRRRIARGKLARVGGRRKDLKQQISKLILHRLVRQSVRLRSRHFRRPAAFRPASEAAFPHRYTAVSYGQSRLLMPRVHQHNVVAFHHAVCHLHARQATRWVAP